jgi:hypothetical protein
MLLVVFGGLLSFNGIGIMSALAFCLLFVVHLALLGNKFRDDFQTASVYLFTRGENRARWLAQKFISVAVQSLMYYFILILVAVCYSVMKGYVFDAEVVIAAIACLFLTLVLANTLFVLVVNTLTIRLNENVIYAFTLALYAGWIFLLPLSKRADIFLRLVPITRSIMLIHMLPAELGEMRTWLAVSLRIPLFETVLFMCAGFAVLYFISWAWIKKTNLLGV